MKALVLSGGAGTRLRPFSYSMPKQLIPIANKPVLEHVLENIRDLDITDVGVIVGDWGPEIREVIGDGSRLGVRITYIPQEKPLGLAHCVAISRAFLGDDDFVLYLGDNMLPEGVADVAEQFTKTRPDAHVVVQKVPDPQGFGVAELGTDGRVEHLVEKPSRPRSDLALIGVYFFTDRIHRAVAAIGSSARGELEITDAIQWLVRHGHEVRASEYTGYWKDTGRVEDVLECNQQLLGCLTTDVRGDVDALSRLSGRVVIEEGARVLRSQVEGPVIIGAGTVVEDSRIGPGTTVGRHCVVRYTRLTYSIVMDGACITAVPGLRGSVIGRNATVGAGRVGDADHRLVVGDDTRIEVTA
ncbi:glucose-1-phosphate thymidylyltransferase [Streptomyces sp. GMR22]|uniref:glucose-1-phosphate thymidylyltransferase n=1 Tax=Streptomyces sp. GMR22 TaxID=2759524 RepID=UPI0015FCB464|nr:glucose-1-phosphate thymidylyltransferase [Streptomyces sp. GMR22]MBA6437035.1 glucose-1-phosphate thymidylyltransferase [Streptomyces sp. GMR22]